MLAAVIAPFVKCILCPHAYSVGLFSPCLKRRALALICNTEKEKNTKAQRCCFACGLNRLELDLPILHW